MLFLSTLGCTGVPAPARAQGSYTAVSCNQSDVNAVINGPTHTAVNGDTIIIPQGTCTWTSGITVSGVGIDITGQGTPNTGPSTVGAGTPTTTMVQDTSSPLFTVTGLTYGQTMKVELLNLQAEATTSTPLEFLGTCSSSGCPSLRVDNINFVTGWSSYLTGGLTICDNFFGVLDHNTANEPSAGGSPPLAQISFDSWQGVGNYGDNSFASPDTFGTNQTLFIENNSLTGARGTENDVGVSSTQIGGARYVCRFNTWNNLSSTGACTAHGTAWGGRFRGQRQVEFYGNTIQCGAAGYCNAGTGLLSGTGHFFGNVLSASEGFNYFLTLDVPRTWRGQVPWYACDGSGNYDQNTGTTYSSGTITTSGTTTFSDSSKSGSWTTNEWQSVGSPYSAHDMTQNFGADIASNTTTQITVHGQPYAPSGSPATWNMGDSYEILKATACLDQTGTGQDSVLLSGLTPTPTGWVGAASDPVYEWADTSSSGSIGLFVYNETVRLQASRDYYAEVSQSPQSSSSSPFNGTSGTGYGTLANRPTSCTTGVGYYATDQGSWNQSGSNFPGQSFSQGELFVCTATNTWTLTYTPYTYPHPLTQTTAPDPPTNVQWVAH
jgi:hypothetical protein